MAFAPPSTSQHVNAPRTNTFRTWYRDILEIKELFHARKYKRCTARCEELREMAVHPLHKTFLAFYQALSYESIGMATHIYSHNKLPMLNLAKDCFSIALQNLPLPYVDDDDFEEANHVDSPVVSPACTTLEIMKRYQYPSPLTTSSTVSPCESGFTDVHDHVDGTDTNTRPFHGRNSSTSSTYSADQKFVTDKVPDFDVYSPRRDIFERVTLGQPKVYLTTPQFANTPNFDENSTGTWTNTSVLKHKVRLSQSLSSQHCLAEELVPSPLFNKQIKIQSFIDETPSKPPLPSHFHRDLTAHDQSRTDVNTTSKQNPDSKHAENKLSSHQREVHDQTHNRPLPPLPFNHKPTFVQKGSRHILVPTHRPKIRASAIQTLVAKFEGKIVTTSSPPSSVSTNTWPKTPITARFKMIEGTFAIRNPSNDQTSKPPTHLSTFTSTSTLSHDPNTSYYPGYDHDMAHLNLTKNLTTFRTALHNHLSHITTQIAHTTDTQHARRAATVSRSMSFWSFDVRHTNTTNNNNTVYPRVRDGGLDAAREKKWRARREIVDRIRARQNGVS